MGSGKHLFFLVHGLFGNSEHLKSLKDQLDKQFEAADDVVVYAASSNQSFSTFDGIVAGVDRLLRELIAEIERIHGADEDGPRVTHISFIGYSLGGLLARYLIGVLHENGFFDSVTPVLFATFATPHIGTRFHSKRTRALLLNTFGGAILGRVGGDLFGRSNLLEELADPAGKYFQGLKRFQHLYLFANTANDRTVPFWTSYISDKNPFRKLSDVDVVFFDHTKAYDASDATKAGRKPFMVDMQASTWKQRGADSESDDGGTAATPGRRLRFSPLPVFLPILALVLSGITLSSWTKYLVFGAWDDGPAGHKALIEDYLRKHPGLLTSGKPLSQELEREVPEDGTAAKSAKATDPAIDPVPRDDSADPATPDGVERAAAATGDTLDKALDGLGGPSGAGAAEDEKDGDGASAESESDGVDAAPHSESTENVAPRPAPGNGYAGLIDAVPYSLRLDAAAQRQVDHLNTLPWNKYAVRFDFFYAHGEIVDRGWRKQQGYELQRFFAGLVHGLLTPARPEARL